MTSRTDAQPKFAPHLAQWALVLWVLFLLWSALAAILFPLKIGDLAVTRWLAGDSPTAHQTGPGLALAWLLRQFDLIWIVLAFANLYLFTVRTDGLAAARRWFAILLGSTFFLACLNAATGFPFGDCFYSQRLGIKFFGWVPVGLPLFWTVVILSAFHAARLLVAKTRPLSPAAMAAVVGSLTGLTAWNLEKIALLRHYWRGESWFPVWGLVGFLLYFTLRGGRVAPVPLPQPLIILGAFNFVFLLFHLFA